LDSPEDVRPAEPAAIPQGRLDDDLDTRTHGFDGPIDRFVDRNLREIDDFEPLCSERVHVAPLMIKPASLKNGERRIKPIWGRPLASGYG
jgi:hypothetical protein